MELAADSTPLPELVAGLSSAVRALARTAKNVPQASDIYYYKNIPEYRALSNDVSSRAQGLLAAAATHLTRPVPSAAAAGGASSTHQATTAVAAGSADDDEDVQFERLTSLLDDTYERLDTALDEAKASSAALKLGGWAVAVHHRQPLRAAARGLTGSSVARVAGGGRVRRHVADLARPQDTFPDPVDNSEGPWSPSKFPHLAAQLVAAADSCGSSSSMTGVHPYRAELGSLQYQPWQLQKQQQQQQEADTAAAVDVMDLESVPVTLVDAPEGLSAMVSALQGVKQVAIDLEHHSYRSYQGFTCLLQLSTREADWVVDTLALRAQLGPALAPLLADPGVEKVLHGADNDILWLQRDFGLHIINLFDTGQAARVLAYPSASLAHLLERHTGFVADKRYQLADWRLRPLPQDMLAYARADTWFLLAVSDRLKDELRALGDRVPPSWATDLPPHSGATGSLGVVLERSRQLCLQQYTKPALTPMSHLEAALSWGLALPPRNMGVFGALFAWRDRTARALDESVHYVLPKGALIELARAMPPTGGDVRKLLGKASGLSGAAALVLSRADEVAQVIVHGQQQQQQQQPTPGEGATAAAANGAAAAAVVKPKELPAIVPRMVGAIAVKAVSVKPSGGSSGMRGLFGKGGSSSSAQQQQQQQQQQPDQAEQLKQAEQPSEGQIQHRAEASDHQKPPAAAAAGAADGVQGSSLAAAKPLAPARKTSSSLGGLFSHKRPAAAAPAAAGAAAKKASFKVDFLTVTQPDTAATAAAAAAGDEDGEPEAEVAAAEEEGEQQGSMQGTSAAEMRAAVDQMMAEGEQSGEASEDEETAAAAVAAAAEEADAGLSEDLEYVPLSQQGSVKKRRRQAAAAAVAAAAAGGSDIKQPKLELAAGGQQNGGKRKGIFAGLGDDASGSSDASDLEAGIAAMPSFDPNRLAAAATAAAAGGSAAEAAAGEEEGGGHCRRGRGRGRGGRGSGGRRGGRQQGVGRVGGRGSLASVRRRGGGAVGGGGGGMFEVQDGPFKAARRKGVAGSKSRTFK